MIAFLLWMLAVLSLLRAETVCAPVIVETASPGRVEAQPLGGVTPLEPLP